MSDEANTREEAIALAKDWAEGRRSWTNLGPHEPYTPDVIAVMDAQEVVKWSALAHVLPSTGAAPPTDTTSEHPAEPCPMCGGGKRVRAEESCFAPDAPCPDCAIEQPPSHTLGSLPGSASVGACICPASGYGGTSPQCPLHGEGTVDWKLTHGTGTAPPTEGERG